VRQETVARKTQPFERWGTFVRTGSRGPKGGGGEGEGRREKGGDEGGACDKKFRVGGDCGGRGGKVARQRW